MLLILDNSLSVGLENGGGDLISTSVELLSLIHREGKHIVSGRRPVLESILSQCLLSAKAKATLKKIRNEVTQYLLLQGAVNRYMRVVYKATKAVEERGDQRILHVPVSQLQDSSTLQETILLAENLRDTKLYLHCGQVYKAHLRMKALRVTAETRGGGGSQVVDEFRSIAGKEPPRLCLCVVDSDKKSPDGAVGDIARRIKSKAEANHPMCEAFVTRVGMIENHLSTKQLSESSIGDKDRMAAVSFLEQIESDGAVELRKFLNLKKGINLLEIMNRSPGDPVRVFLIGQLRALYRRKAISGGPCLECRECVPDASCCCDPVPGFGETILDNVLEKLKKMSISKIEESLCETTRDEWLHIGKLVFAWCCARSSVSV